MEEELMKPLQEAFREQKINMFPRISVGFLCF